MAADPWLVAADILDELRPAGGWRDPDDWQIAPPGDWHAWVLLAGRGTGKTAASMHWLDEHVNQRACIPSLQGGHRPLIVGPTLGDAMESIESSPSALMVQNPAVRVRTSRGGTFVRWPNGVRARVLGAHTREDAERFRASGNTCCVIAEEMAAWRRLDEVWPHLDLGLRLGQARLVVPTTPKPRARLKAILGDTLTVVTGAKTQDARYLPAHRKEQLIRAYAGTRLGRQELEGVMLEDVEGALWDWDTIEAMRLGGHWGPDELRVLRESMPRFVVALDPTSGRGRGDDYGLIAGGQMLGGRTCAVLEDASGKGPGEQWAVRLVELYDRWQADAIVVEQAFGQLEQVRLVLKACGFESRSLPIKAVPARVGKYLRAEPVAALCARTKGPAPGVPDPALFLAGTFPDLEDQLTTWVPPERASDESPASTFSPGRVDAMCYLVNDLLLLGSGPRKTGAGFASGRF